MLALSMALMVQFFDAHRLLRPNVLSVMYISHIVFQFIAALVLLSDPSASEAPRFFMLCCVTALLIPVGGLIGRALLPAGKLSEVALRRGPMDDSPRARKITFWFFIAYLSCCLILFISYTSKVGMSPLFWVVSGSLQPDMVGEARVETGVSSVGLVYGVALRFFMPVLFLLGLLGLTYYRSVMARIACIAGLVVAFLYNAWAMDKTPVTMLFVLAVLALLLKQEEQGKLSWLIAYHRENLKHKLRRRKKYLYVWATVLALLSVAYPIWVFLYKPAASHGLLYIIEHVFLRIAWKPAFNAYMAVEAFSSSFSHTHFADIYKLTRVTGQEYIDLSREIAVYKGQTDSSNAPPPAFANFYVQAGWAAVILGVLFASAAFKVLENVIYRTRVKSIVHIAMYCVLLFGAFRFSWANFHTILATEVMAPLLALLGIWSVFRRLSYSASISEGSRQAVNAPTRLW